MKNKITIKECPTNQITTTTTMPITSKILNEFININTASLDKLITLKGIGSSIAEKIIEYRLLKSFNCIADIKNVKGVGETIFAQIKDYITV